MEDYSSEIRVLKGLNIASVVIQILSIIVLLVVLVLCAVGGAGLTSYLAGAMAETTTVSVAADASSAGKVILADQSKDIEDMTDEELDAFIDGMTSGEYDSFIDSMTDEEFYRFMDRYYGEGFSDSFDDYLDHKLGDGADVTDPEAEAILGVTSALVIAIIVVMCLLALALSIYCLVVSILILRAKNDPTHFKRYFVMSIVAASLCLVTGIIVSTVLFVLTSVWIYKVRKKAGQIATKAPQPVNPVQ